jgi:MtN3 and saliva related transmembrane protein|tara:strand:+ start:2086 stop:2346 length:261 start_codon:yes stop_codon:yes gene_type:complete
MDVEIIGFVAALLTTSAFVPQVVKVWKSKSSMGVSVSMYLVLLLGVFLWGVYGYLIDSMSIMIANTVTGLLQLMILILILMNKNKD